MLELSTREVGRLNPLNSRETLKNNSEPNQQPTGHAKEGLALFWLLIGSKNQNGCDTNPKPESVTTFKLTLFGSNLL